MILKALCDYYNRCGDLPRKGLELKEIGYLIVIRQDGAFVRIESRMKDKRTATQFLVIQAVKRSGKKFVANCLWDNTDYVIGGEGSLQQKNNAFISRVEELKVALPQNAYLNAMAAFYNRYKEQVERALSADPLWPEVQKTNKNLSFLIEGKMQIAAVDEDVIAYSAKQDSSAENTSICLVTGQNGTTARIHAKVPFQGNAFTSLVSFKDGKGYDSYGKTQGSNAPVGEDAEFAYTTALNHLLSYDSHNKFMLGSRTFVFWASTKSVAAQKMEEGLFELLGFSTAEEDDPNARIEEVRKVFEAIYSGTLKTSLDDRFYILGLAPNSARIAVVYWSETSLKDFAEMIERHFSDMEIVDTRKDKKPYTGLRDMLSTVTLGGKMSDATPNLPEAVAKSIFQGLPYPYTLYSSCIRRIRAEQGDVRIGRAAIIKAYLNRLPNGNNNKKIKVMLDKENTNQGYLCGRLFAVLDKIQEDANNIHSIRERYMNAASTTPSAVFATILNLSTHHSEKLSSEGSRVHYEKLKQEIISNLPADGFPTHLDLQDQGRFFIGYYHQRQDFFTKKEDTTNE